ncbi:phage portal protein [Aeromicrobium sp.]|uniref:phage portal protein n=1 Tax=Aeromicrobium sp. TaxID=1871063 RepID=UPI0030BAB640
MVFLVGILLKSLGLETLADEPAQPVYPTIDTELALAQARRKGRGLTLETAVGLPGVYRAIQLIYGKGSSLPLNSWRGTVLAERQPQVVRQPDPWRTPRSWKLRTLTNMAGDGNAFLKKSLSPLDDGTVIAAEALNPFAVAVRWKDGRKLYDHRTRTGTEILSAEQVEHVRLNEFPGLDRGIGPIEACRVSLTGGMDIRDYAAGFFDRGAIPPGVLTSDQVVDKATATAAKEWWHEGDAAEIKVMGKGLKFDPILIKPADAQWIEAQSFTVLDIARMFGIPPVLLLASIEGSSLTYQNLQMVNEQLLTDTLGPLYLEAIEAAMTALIPAGQEARFDVSKLTRRDDKTRMQTHKLAIEAGVYDADHARVQEGIPGPAPRKESVPV